MAKRRLIAKLETAFIGRFVKVYRDAEYNEFRVVGASGNAEDYYCTDDKLDAMQTAQALVKLANDSANDYRKEEC